MKNKSFILLTGFMLIASVSILSASNAITKTCMSLEQHPLSVTTSPVHEITATSAKGGFVISGAVVPNAKYGICLSGKPAPTINNTIFAADKGTGPAFNVSMSGLRPGTKCYIRAFVTTSTGTIYGNEVSFTTPAIK